jgi:hypothetical protein
MPLCESFSALIPIEQRNYVGSIIHCVMNDEGLYKEGLKLIKKGERLGLFRGIIINPIEEINNSDTPNNIDL